MERTQKSVWGQVFRAELEGSNGNINAPNICH